MPGLADAAIGRWGRIDALVDNAGITSFAGASNREALDPRVFHAVYDVNVVGAFQMVPACVAHPKAVDGSIVNVSPIAGALGIGSSVAYIASKGALDASWPDHDALVRRRRRRRRLREAEGAVRAVDTARPRGTAEDVAETIAWLVDGARTVTGELVLLDAGMHPRRTAERDGRSGRDARFAARRPRSATPSRASNVIATRARIVVVRPAATVGPVIGVMPGGSRDAGRKPGAYTLGFDFDPIMEARVKRVTGIGGIFFQARDPVALQAWYRKHLGIDVQDWGGTAFSWTDDRGAPVKGTTVWSVGAAGGDHFAPSESTFMVNYRVADLTTLLRALREEGCDVLEKTDDSGYGKFGWVMDPDGNKVELWEPPEGQ